MSGGVLSFCLKDKLQGKGIKMSLTKRSVISKRVLQMEILKMVMIRCRQRKRIKKDALSVSL